ncbi:MAG: hypothetical protein IPJ28_09730 [Betaproteobacteria bacterium]|nr:hypothetical protein [Betaproteobacteria bacterium]
MDARLLPSLPLAFNPAVLFGVLLVAGMLGGEVARQLRLPRVISYVLRGLRPRPLASALNIGLSPGRGPLLRRHRPGPRALRPGPAHGPRVAQARLDARHATSMGESLAASGLVFAALHLLGFPPLQPGITAAIAMATSPDRRAAGGPGRARRAEVAGRAFTLVALNSLVASVIVTMLTASVHYEVKLDLDTAVLHPLYLFAGSLALGGALAALARGIAGLVERSPELHFTLLAGFVVAAVGLAQAGKLSVILSLLAFGLFARNGAAATTCSPWTWAAPRGCSTWCSS